MKPWILRALAAAACQTVVAGTVRIDFGKNNVLDGNVTTSPDSNGNYWNNLFNDPLDVPEGQSVGQLVETDNTPTQIRVTCSASWRANGIRNGGLLNPDPLLLGELAVATATQDYYFVDSGLGGGTGTMTISGLRTDRCYTFRMFGTRDTSSTRHSRYTLTGADGAEVRELQTSGAGAGSAANPNGNDDDLVEFADVRPDSTGTVSLNLSIVEGGFAYLGLMEIVEGAAVPGTVRVDFGKNNGDDGNVTTSPDGDGNHWNNLFNDPLDVPSGYTVGNFVDSTNQPTPIRITCSAGVWRANGIRNGGLLDPDPSLLGSVAVPTATQDYFFVEEGNGGGGTGTMSITGLRPDRLYTFRMFGTRDTGATRRSRFTLAAASGTQVLELQTSGTGAGSAAHPTGNDDDVVQFTNVQTDTNGTATLTLTIVEGGFAYLGTMEIIEGAAAPVIPGTVPGALANWVAQDQLDPPAAGSVLFIGSSSIRRWESVTRDFADYHVVQRGWGGSWLSEMDDAFPYVVLPYNPSAIVMWAGTNDLSGGRSGEQVHEDFLTFLHTLRRQLPTTPFFYLGVTPTLANGGTTAARQTANSLIQATAGTDPHTYFIDLPSHFESLTQQELEALYVDPIHLNRAGYAVWLDIIRPQVEAVVAPNKSFVANPDAPVAGDRVLFDLGPHDVLLIDGHATDSPDANGNHWNNWFAVNGGVGINSGEHKSGLVNSDGRPNGLTWTITGGYIVNGLRNGGLFAPNGPNSGLLGDFAIQTATEDYFFCTADDLNGGGDDDVPGGFMLSGLDPALEYTFRLFGTRDSTDVRTTEYAIYGIDRRAVTLQTSGPDIGSNGTYDGNDDEIVEISGVRPDAFGQVFLDMLVIQGNFAYLGAMEIVASDPSATGGLQSWRELHFTPGELGNPALEAGLWGNLADADFDGIPNLVEYAQGTDPREAGPAPVTHSLDGGVFSLTYQRDTNATDVSFGAEKSEGLIDWSTVTDDVFISEADGIETRKASVPVTGFPKQMLRLKAVATGTL